MNKSLPIYIDSLKTTLKLAVPVSIGQLGHVMLGVVDSIMVGHVGTAELAAASLVNSLFFIILVFGIGMTIAITPLVAIANGENNHEKCGIILRQGLLVNTLFGLILFSLSYLTADFINLLNQPDDVSVLAESYLKILSFSIPPYLFFQSYRQFIDGLENTKPAMYIAVIANIINIIGNWIFIYGNLGFEPLGLDGAGYASFFTRLFMAVSIFIYVTSKKSYKKYDPSLKLKSVNLPVIKKLLSLGIPMAFQLFFEVAAFSVAAIIIGWLGKFELAAHQIAINMAAVTFMVILGISSAATIQTSGAFGKRNMALIKKNAISAILLTILFEAVFAIVFLAGSNILPFIYTNDINVIRFASNLLIVAAFFQISDGLQATGLGLLRGITDVKIPTLISFTSYWILGVPIGYILGFYYNLGVTGVWIGLLIGLSFAAIFFLMRFYYKLRALQLE